MSDFIVDLSKLAKKLGKPPTKEQLSTAQEFIDLAQQDLKSSRLNYESKIFNLATYHLQQSVEKTAKAYYNILGILDNKIMRKTGHDSPELFLRMAELPWAQQFAQFAKEASGTDFIIDTSQAQAVVDTKSKRVEMAKLNVQNITGFLGLIPKIEQGLNPLFAVMGKDFIMASLRLYVLSGLTFPHEEFSRYPDGAMKPTEYTAELGIVAMMPNIWTEAETAISEVQRLIDVSQARH